ncbi:MAG: hypothetical protein R2729_07995 [Bryobacteraceae bacterium]
MMTSFEWRPCMAAALMLAAAANLAAQRVRVTETAGIERRREPVTVEIGGKERVVYVSIGAGKTRTFRPGQLRHGDTIDIRPTDPVGFTVENSVYLADLSKRLVGDKPEDSGTLRALTYKRAGVTLKRTQNRMHWAPSFQRAGARGYTSIAMWDPVQEHSRDEVDGMVRFRRAGWHPLYPELALEAEYRFFPHVPYFLFSATVKVVKPIEMYWLRGQEMTMDALFTHAAWPGADGKAVVAAFDERAEAVARNPLAVDMPWIVFLNRERGYAFGAVTLGYEATTVANAKMSINDGANNGKYWDRYYVGQTATTLRPGDRYHERTAYVLARDLDEFLAWEKKLRNPLRVEVMD